MALHYDIGKVKNWKSKQKKYATELEILIFSSLAIGMGDLNDKTLEEFCYRLNRYSQEVGPLAYTHTGKTLIWTAKKLSRWLGLHTNVHTISNAAFDQNVRERSGRAKRRY